MALRADALLPDPRLRNDDRPSGALAEVREARAQRARSTRRGRVARRVRPGAACENGCGRIYPVDTQTMTLVVTAAGAFVQLCDPCHRAYRAGYEAAQELERMERRIAAITEGRR